jgi:hypothetical protein
VGAGIKNDQRLTLKIFKFKLRHCSNEVRCLTNHWILLRVFKLALKNRAILRKQKFWLFFRKINTK